MRLPIAGKIAITVVLALLCSNTANTLVTMRLMAPPLDESVDSTIHIMKAMMQRGQEQFVAKFKETAVFIGEDTHLIEAVAAGDGKRCQELAAEMMKEAGAELMTVTDDKGVVLARGHASSSGDNLASQATVAAALRGESTTGIVRSREVPISLRAGTPLKKDGKVVGTVAIGLSLTSETYIDSLKTHPDVDATIFIGENRAMTTIKKDGVRQVGTRLENRAILEAVEGRGEDLYQDAMVLGMPYKAVYWPLRDLSGQTIGMWFLGYNLSKIEADKSRAATMSMLTGLGIVLVFMLVAFVVGGMIASPVRKITAFATAVAGGDMDARLDVRSSDETAELSAALRTMVGNLKDRIAEAARQSELAGQETQKAQAAVRAAEEAQARAESARREGILHAAEQLAGVSAASSNAANSLSAQIRRGRDGASHQAERLAETATAMEEMNAAVLEVARTAGTASDASNQTRNEAEHGADVARQAVDDIQAVREQSLKLMDGMRELDGVSRSISQVMNVISDIADQTNLLALNAAIEAARAGEAGRGFAVVADEVRKLAEKTMTSTTDVGHAIRSIQESAARSVAQVEQAVGQIEQSTTRVTESGEALARIVALAESTADQVRGIAAASEEQSASSDEINRSISEVSGISDETLEAMNEAERAVNDLTAQIRTLTDLIDEMKRA